MLHISICNDEDTVGVKIKELVEGELEITKVRAVVEFYPEREEFVDKYAFRDDELIIMDIDVQEQSVFDMIENLDEIHKGHILILLTGQEHLALKALPYGPFQIVGKANVEEELPKAVRRFLRIRNQRRGIVEFTKNRSVAHIEKKRIVYMEKCVYNICVHMSDGSVFSVKRRMYECEEALSGMGFIRPHSGYIVNMEYCVKIEKQTMILKDGTLIPISRERRNMVRGQFMIGGML